jgi:predicted Kef-type K+ transport protein
VSAELPATFERCLRKHDHACTACGALLWRVEDCRGATELFGLSFALGAFFAGVVVGESDHSHRAAAELQPLQDAFSALFFVAMGMRFDPTILARQPLQVLALVAVVVLGKSAVAFLIVLLLHYPVGTALIIAASLAQIGEFSFILAELGIALLCFQPRARADRRQRSAVYRFELLSAPRGRSNSEPA